MVSRQFAIGIAVVAIVVIGVVSGYFWYMYLSQRAGVPPPKDYIIVGFTISLTGPIAGSAIGSFTAYQICADYINSQGGIYVAEYGKKLPVKLIYYDDSSDPNKVRSLYEKLVAEDKVDFLFMPFGTPLGLAVVPIINKYEIPVALSSQTMTSREQIRNLSRYIYVTARASDDQGAMYLAVLKKIISDHPELKKIAIIYPEQDSPAAWAFWTKRYVEQEKVGEIVFYASYPFPPTDLRGLLSRMADAKPDIVVVMSFVSSEASAVVSQMRELKINPKVLIMATGPSFNDFYTKFDNATKEGIIMWTNWYPDQHPLLKRFWEILVSKHGYGIGAADGLALKSCLIWKEAVEKAGTLDKVKIKHVLDNEIFDTPFGKIRFVDQIADPPDNIWVQYQDGLLKAVFWTVGKYPNITFVDAPFLVPYEYPKPEWW